MNRSSRGFVSAAFIAIAFEAFAANTVLPSGTIPRSIPTADYLKIDAYLGRFEKQVTELAARLSRMNEEMAKLQKESERLKEESSILRGKLESSSSLLVEARLKALLNTLRGKLEAQTDGENRREALRGEFEEAALSLMSLYNDSIEREITSTEAFVNPAGSEKGVNTLVDLARKRSKLQSLIELHRKSPTSSSAVSQKAPLEDLPPLKDRESVMLAIRLLKDRRVELETRQEESALKENEILQEIRLQERMREFMEDIAHLRDNTAYPSAGGKLGDLGWMQGRDRISHLRKRHQEILRQREKDQTALIQLDAYLDQMNYQLNQLKGKRGVKP